MNLLLLILHLLIIFSLVRLFINRIPDTTLHFHGWFSAGLKLVAGIGLGLVYRYYYSAGDTFVFHEEALKFID